MQHEEMINERIDQLIAEYLSGSLTADAFQELKNWSQQSDENRMYVRNQIEVWFSSGVTAKDKVFDKDAYSGGYPFSISGDIRSVPS
jgi:transmembrane sensor